MCHDITGSQWTQRTVQPSPCIEEPGLQSISPCQPKDFIVSILLSWVPLKMYGVFSPWCGLIATYVASCSSSVGDVANILEGGVEVTGFTGTVPPPQQCRGRRKGGREVTNKLRTRVSAVACSFLVRSSWFFCATRCSSFLLTHRDSNGLIATYVTSCSSSVGNVASVLEGGVAVTGFTSTVPPPQQCRAKPG